MLWEIFWGALHVCRSKIGDVENSFQIRHIFESLWPRGCSLRDYATQEANQELKWKLRTISVWQNRVLESLVSHSWDTWPTLLRVNLSARKLCPSSQRYTYRVLQTLQMKLIILWFWVERAVLGRAKTALKFKYKI